MLSAVVLVLSAAIAAQGGKLLAYTPAKDTESGRGIALLADELPAFSDSYFALIFESSTEDVNSSVFRQAMLEALAPLANDTRVSKVVTPYDLPAAQAAILVSRDGRRALALVSVNESLNEARTEYLELRSKVTSTSLEVTAAEGLAIYHDFDAILERDLQRAEMVTFPLVLLLLLVVFGTVVAAVLPLGVGLLAVSGAVAAVFLLSQTTDVSIYALNVVTLIGIGVAIDYSLFIVARFREELASGRTVEEALAVTMKTAGRAITFSGLTVVIGLSALMFYQGLFFASMGLAGALVVALAVFYALTFLPAVLSIIGHGVNRWRLPLPARRGAHGFWRNFAKTVMERPLAVLVPAVAILLIAGAPALNMHLASGGVAQLPAYAESHRGDEILAADFPDRGRSSVQVIVEYGSGDPLSAARVGALYDLSRNLSMIPHVIRVESIVDLDPTLARSDYQAMYSAPRETLPSEVAAALHQSVGAHVVLVNVVADVDATSDGARSIVDAARSAALGADGEIVVTGFPAVDIDTLGLIARHTPTAVAFIVVVTYFLLLVQTGSVILPLKALVMNVLSISASFGALVWIFQEGNLSGLLGFSPSSIEPSLPVILFCAVFGLSMDYEVLMLSRMHEEYVRTGDNTHAVAEGLERSARLITGAAAIMVIVFSAFGLADVVLIKAIGIGLAIAIAIDATIVRALIVPATMRLMGDWNWWSPTLFSPRGEKSVDVKSAPGLRKTDETAFHGDGTGGPTGSEAAKGSIMPGPRAPGKFFIIGRRKA
ncbi:MAG: MMPL family transporter [Euryarchaeota archaeon]|nr:MMPL family transporter [Euryarchaeota archaeon]